MRFVSVRPKQFLRFALLFALGVASAQLPCANAQRTLPDFGVILTDDGVKSFTDLDPLRSEAALRAMIRSLHGSPVNTLVYEVAAGSQVMFYPTRVGSVWGWRSAAGESEEAWKTRMPINRAAVQNGLDAVRIAGTEAKAMGLYFMPGYRMNDAHFARNPMSNVLTGEFWIRNHERLTFGMSPVPGENNYGALFDFSHAEVREQCRAVIFEIIDRYADLMDGIQLDFMRHPLFFPPGTAEDRAQLMTELLISVRHKLDEVAKREGRSFALSIRVPAALATCRRAGLDVPTWVEQGLVDVIIPAPSISLSHDMPLEDFVALAKPHGVKIAPALFPRTHFHWRFRESPLPGDYEGMALRNASEAQIRGAVRNYRLLGASGIEFYNFNLPPEKVGEGAFHAVANPAHGDRIYEITQAYWPEREGIFEYRKQIPVTLVPGKGANLGIFTAEDWSALDLQRSYAALRLGLRGPARESSRLEIRLNGIEIFHDSITRFTTEIGGRAQPSRLQAPAAQAYFQLRLTEVRFLQPGRNDLTVSLDTHDAMPLEIVEAQIAIITEAK